MTDHVVLVPDRARRNLRTILNVALSVALVVLGLVPVLLQAVEPLQENLPGGWYLWLVGITGTIVAVATAVQRILTSSVVEQLLQDKASALAAAPMGSDGVTVITDISTTEYDDMRALASALAPGDPSRAVLERILRA